MDRWLYGGQTPWRMGVQWSNPPGRDIVRKNSGWFQIFGYSIEFGHYFSTFLGFNKSNALIPRFEQGHIILVTFSIVNQTFPLNEDSPLGLNKRTVQHNHSNRITSENKYRQSSSNKLLYYNNCIKYIFINTITVHKAIKTDKFYRLKLPKLISLRTTTLS